jgi:hypothetical protein
MSSLSVHFCTFGNIPQYNRALETLLGEARASGYFASLTAFTQETLPSTEKERIFMRTHSRGYGYWIWKALLLEEMFTKVPEGEFIFYVDAGCGISTTPAARANMAKWIADCEDHPTHRISFQTSFPAEVWTKADLVAYLGATEDCYTKTGQHIAGIQLYKNTPDNRDFVMKWKTIMEIDDFHYVSDEPSRVANPECFRDHRHDQSILSLLFKMHGSKNYSYMAANPDAPIMVLRRRGG